MISYINNTDYQTKIKFETLDEYIDFYANKYIYSNYSQPENNFWEETTGISFKEPGAIEDWVDQTVADQLKNNDYNDWHIEENQGIKTLIIDSNNDCSELEKRIGDILNSKKYNVELFKSSVVEI